MSAPTGHGHGPTGAHSAAAEGHDDVDYGKVIKVGVASLLLFAASVVWAGRILQTKTAEIQAKTGKARSFDLKRQEIGIVDQVPFVTDKRLPRWQQERHAFLTGYGWVDRAKGVVRIPVEDAMAKVVAGTMPTGAPK